MERRSGGKKKKIVIDWKKQIKTLEYIDERRSKSDECKILNSRSRKERMIDMNNWEKKMSENLRMNGRLYVKDVKQMENDFSERKRNMC